MIVLASKSASRRAMLGAAGVEFDVVPAAIDERALEAELGSVPPGSVALALAEAKALSVEGGRLPVLGSDSVVSVAGLLPGEPLTELKVRELSEDFITRYLAAEWPEVSQCVGVFRIEAMGVQLFESIEGDMFTVLGMPLLPVLGALRELEELPA